MGLIPVWLVSFMLKRFGPTYAYTESPCEDEGKVEIRILQPTYPKDCHETMRNWGETCIRLFLPALRRALLTLPVRQGPVISRTVRNRFCCVSPSVCRTLLWQPLRSNTHMVFLPSGLSSLSWWVLYQVHVRRTSILALLQFPVWSLITMVMLYIVWKLHFSLSKLFWFFWLITVFTHCSFYTMETILGKKQISVTFLIQVQNGSRDNWKKQCICPKKD